MGDSSKRFSFSEDNYTKGTRQTYLLCSHYFKGERTLFCFLESPKGALHFASVYKSEKGRLFNKNIGFWTNKKIRCLLSENCYPKICASIFFKNIFKQRL